MQILATRRNNNIAEKREALRLPFFILLFRFFLLLFHKDEIAQFLHIHYAVLPSKRSMYL